MEKFSKGKDYKVVAVIMSVFSKDENTRMFRNLDKESHKHNCRLVYFSTLSDFWYNDLNDEGEKKIFTVIPVERFDAILLFSETFKIDVEQQALVDRAHECGVPVITLDKPLNNETVHIHYDYGDVFREISEHMIGVHGFKNVVFMGGQKGNSFSEERLAIFREVCTAHGVTLDDNHVFYGEFWAQPCERELDRMFRMIEDGIITMPEAIICANDAMAITVGKYLDNRGLRVPEDVAISGLDGIELEQYCAPRLTTGVIDEAAFIDKVFEILDSGIDERYTRDTIHIYNKLQIGSSCGCNCLQPAHMGSIMMDLKYDTTRVIQFQMDIGQHVTNHGAEDSFADVMNGMMYFLDQVGHKEFYFVANVDLVDKIEDFAVRNRKYTYEPEGVFTEKMYSWHRTSKEDFSIRKSFSEEVPFGGLAPDFDKLLDGKDSLLIIPVQNKGKVQGYSLLSFDCDKLWLSGYSTFLSFFDHMLGLQLTQIELLKVYMIDQLTGLYNRNGFYQKVNSLLEIGADMDMTIISMDMDGLKKMNDVFGHAEGDFALAAFGEIIQNSIRHEIAARIGGDEFLIAFVGHDIDERSEEIVRSIKKGIAVWNASCTKPYELRASIGIYTNRVRNHTLDHFLKKADDLMYAQKYLHKRENGQF